MSCKRGENCCGNHTEHDHECECNDHKEHIHDEHCNHNHEHSDSCGCNNNHEGHIHETDFGLGYYLSPVGFIKVKTNFDYVVSINFADSEDEKQIETPAVIDTIKQIDEYFKGTRKAFNLKLAINGTPFQKEVYKALLKIPYGKTLSYKDVAVMIGDPSASRAVGSANNKNTMVLAVPCHRVTTANGKLSGTDSWTKTQQYLINHEKELV